jgi:hypothetical protein
LEAVPPVQKKENEPQGCVYMTVGCFVKKKHEWCICLFFFPHDL